jgi:hypothetical protein
MTKHADPTAYWTKFYREVVGNDPEAFSLVAACDIASFHARQQASVEGKTWRDAFPEAITTRQNVPGVVMFAAMDAHDGATNSMRPLVYASGPFGISSCYAWDDASVSWVSESTDSSDAICHLADSPSPEYRLYARTQLKLRSSSDYLLRAATNGASPRRLACKLRIPTRRLLVFKPVTRHGQGPLPVCAVRIRPIPDFLPFHMLALREDGVIEGVVELEKSRFVAD